MSLSFSQKLKYARDAGAPFVSINTTDDLATVRAVVKTLNGSAPCVAWDVLRGTYAVNSAGEEVARLTGEGEEDATTGNPVKFLEFCNQFPAGTVAFLLNANQYLLDAQGAENPGMLQGIQNLREPYKADGRTLLLLGPEIRLPVALQGGYVVPLDEALPDEVALAEIVKELDKAASDGTKRKLMDDATVARTVEAVQGLSAFGAEQAVAMALRPVGIDLDHAWSNKKAQIEQTLGLTLHRGGEKFSDLSGLKQVREYLTAIMKGKKAPKVIVWLD
jgi:hypothetical protein